MPKTIIVSSRRYDKKIFRSVNCYSYATAYIYVKSSQRDR